MKPVVTLFSHSNVATPEDVVLVQYRRGGVIDACVADGVSGFHSPRVPLRWFRESAGEELTGGQAVGRILQRSFLHPPADHTLADTLLDANRTIAAFAARHGIPADPADLPAVHLAAARVGNEQIDIITTGDCFAVWQLKTGAVGATPNLEWPFTRREEPEFERLESLYGSRDLAWTHIEDHFRQLRRELTNVTYATLNGQPGVENLWCRKTLSRGEVALLLLFTDGFVAPEDTLDELRMGKRVLGLYRDGGWPAVLAAKAAGPAGEATAAAVDFRE